MEKQQQKAALLRKEAGNPAAAAFGSVSPSPCHTHQLTRSELVRIGVKEEGVREISRFLFCGQPSGNLRRLTVCGDSCPRQEKKKCDVFSARNDLPTFEKREKVEFSSTKIFEQVCARACVCATLLFLFSTPCAVVGVCVSENRAKKKQGRKEKKRIRVGRVRIFHRNCAAQVATSFME